MVPSMKSASFTLAAKFLATAVVLGFVGAGAAVAVASAGAWHAAGGWLMLAVAAGLGSLGAGAAGLVIAGAAADAAAKR